MEPGSQRSTRELHTTGNWQSGEHNARIASDRNHQDTVTLCLFGMGGLNAADALDNLQWSHVDCWAEESV